jgi:uncharacterized damage-inducible protein DinB
MEKVFIKSLIGIFERDLNQLEKEISLYPDEESLWTLQGQIKNSAGTLCLHLCGNLQHYIGAVLGKSAYVRNREQEFAARNLSRQELRNEIVRAKEAVRTGLSTLDTSLLEQEYPVKVFDNPMSTTFFLIHLAAHFNYHLGQVNYHRRFLV